MTQACDIGLMGLAVMGQNLVLNMEDHGYRVAVYNRTKSKTDEFLAQPQVEGRQIVGVDTLESLAAQLERPRKIMLMIKSGDAVPAFSDQLYPELSPTDAVIEQLLNVLEAGDVIIFTMHTLHTSTRNMSDQWRISCDVRFQPETDSVDNRWVGENPVAHSIQDQSKKPITFDEAREIWEV